MSEMFYFECPDCRRPVGLLSTESFEDLSCEALYCPRCRKSFTFIKDGGETCQNCDRRIGCLLGEPIHPTERHLSFNGFDAKVSRVPLNPDDVLVISTDRHLSSAVVSSLERFVSNKVPGHPVLILDGSLQLAVLGKIQK